MKNKIVGIVMALCLTFEMVGCGDGSTVAVSANEAETVAVTYEAFDYSGDL